MKIFLPALALALLFTLAACSSSTRIATPELLITSGVIGNADGSYTLTGTVTPADAIERLAYELNGEAEVVVPVEDGAFTALLTLQEGSNTIAVKARAKGGRTASKTLTVTHALPVEPEPEPEQRLDSITPNFGAPGTEVILTGLFGADIEVTVCGEPLLNLVLGESNAGSQASTATGVIPGVPVGTECEVAAWLNGERVAGPFVKFSSSPSRMLVTSGTRIDLLAFTADGIEQLEGASLPATFTPKQAIFGARMHPTQPWIYVTSLVTQVWGDASIDRFEITADGLIHRDSTTLVDIEGLDCSAANFCAVTDLAFSTDGTQLYVNEDSSDVVAVFAVDPVSGALEFLFEGDTVWLQGLAVHPEEPYLYNGERAYRISSSAVELTQSGEGGNANVIAERDGAFVMFSTLEDNESFAAYTLSDPAAPQILDTVILAGAGNQGRFLAIDDAADRVLVVGDNHLATYAFDGTAFTARDTHALGGDDSASRTYRGAAWATGTNRAVATWFGWEADGQPIGGYTVLGIAADGTITVLDDVSTAAHSRVATALR